MQGDPDRVRGPPVADAPGVVALAGRVGEVMVSVWEIVMVPVMVQGISYREVRW
jgi:hypothetical protein